MEIWHGLINGLGEILRFFHSIADPVTGFASWGWAIVLLTFTVRLAMLPLAVKQTNSMRAMQQLQPEIKKLQQKYKVDRSMMRTDPEKFREQRAKQQEHMMKLYKEHNVNPAAGCLPLILQMPIFFALFTLLRDTTRIPELEQAGFYLIDSLSALPGQAGAEGALINGAWLLIALMGLTMFYSQRQMMASNPAASQMPQQKVLLYAMPVLLTVFAVNLPVGVLLYWVTTNVWTMGQQWVMFRNIKSTNDQGPERKST